MARSAQVESLEALRRFHGSLVEFREQARSALGDTQTDLRRTIAWLEQEQGPYWQKQAKKCQEQVKEAQRALNEKRLHPSPGGGRPSATEQEQALKKAKRRLELAEEKVAAVRRWRRELDRAMREFQPTLQRLGDAVNHRVPSALADLERAVAALERYGAANAPRPRKADAEPAKPGAARPGDGGDSRDSEGNGPDADPEAGNPKSSEGWEPES